MGLAQLALAVATGGGVADEVKHLGWVNGAEGQSCATACGNKTTCQIARQNAVNSTSSYIVANGAMLTYGGNTAGVTCTGYVNTSSANAPNFRVGKCGGKCHFNSVSSSICDAMGAGQRLCCCTAGGEDPARMCPLIASDCGSGYWFDTTNGICWPNEGCAAGWWRGLSTHSGETCVRCGTVDSSSPAGLTAASSCVCAAGYWNNPSANPGPVCVGCPAGKFGLSSGQTSEASACTGTCQIGKYAAARTGRSSEAEACPDCPAGGDATPADSKYCVATLASTKEWSGWKKSSPTAAEGNTCAAACGAKKTCDATRQNAVSDEAHFEFANGALKGYGGSAAAGFNCSHVSGTNSPYAPHFNSGTDICFTNSASNSACDATTSNRIRLCCCTASDEDPSAMCPLTSTDCGNGYSFDATNKICWPDAGCPAGWYRDTTSPINKCVACPIGKFGPIGGKTSEASACTGTNSTCEVGTYGASLTKSGMTACAICPSHGAETTAGSLRCVRPISGWVKAKEIESCTSICAQDMHTATVCQATRMSAVNTEARFKVMNTALKEVGGSEAAGIACASYGESMEAGAPFFGIDETSSGSMQCAYNAASSSTCDAASSSTSDDATVSRGRVCCCTTVGEDAATMCPVSAADCGSYAVFNSSTSSCVVSEANACPAGRYFSANTCVGCSPGEGTKGLTGQTVCHACSPGLFSNDYNDCVGKCPAGRFSKQAGLTTESDCVGCEPHTMSLIGASKCEVCVGGYPNEQQDGCLRCATGAYRAYDGECSTCPTVGVECEASVLQVRAASSSLPAFRLSPSSHPHPHPSPSSPPTLILSRSKQTSGSRRSP